MKIRKKIIPLILLFIIIIILLVIIFIPNPVPEKILKCDKTKNCCRKNEDCLYSLLAFKCTTREYTQIMQQKMPDYNPSLPPIEKLEKIKCRCVIGKCVTLQK